MTRHLKPGLASIPIIALLALAGCGQSPDPIVGAWIVKDALAPFPVHMYVYNADGTLQQANPDAGDPHASDSDGKGAWIARDGHIRGKWVEITADRTTRRFSGRAEISFDIKVSGDTFTGTETAEIFDADGRLTQSLNHPGQITGQRVKAAP